jgi:hypothetical protein
MKPGTGDALLAAGARDRVLSDTLAEKGLGDLPVLTKGQPGAVYIKGELGHITYGLRKKSVGIFNDNILGYSEDRW